MQFIDTHSHLYESEFEDDLEQVIFNAIHNGVYKIILPNVDFQTVEPMLATVSKYKNCYPMIGLHPTSVNADYLSVLEKIYTFITEKKHSFCAIGEIGVDLYWDKTFREEQMKAFCEQMYWSLNLDLPVAIHSRKAFDEIFLCLKKLNKKTFQGVFHCFGGDLNQAEKLIEMGFKLGIGGVLTFKNASLVEVVRKIDLKHIVLETDSPYLAPVPFRGKRNESAYIVNIARKLAEIKQLPLETIAFETTKNALELFPKINA